MALGPDGPIGRCETRGLLGRPLFVDGSPQVADCHFNGRVYSRLADAESKSVIEELLTSAREEHASIAAFARTISELMALGAPSWLLSQTQEALADEIHHTELTLDLIERLTGARPVLGRLAAAVAPLRSGEHAAAELLRDVFRGGAVGETLAAARAERLRIESTQPEYRVFYDVLVLDESRHAALAFQTIGWLLTENPSLARVLDEELLRFRAQYSGEERKLVEPLLHLLTENPARLLRAA
jgi:hypothetical protein